MHRTIYVTYCSAGKRRDPGLLPAIERYESARIRGVAARAEADGATFRILSGEFGLLAPGEPIPWYDHLLRPDEAMKIAVRVSVSIHALGVLEVVFFTAGADADPNLAPYHAAIAEACRRVGAKLRLEAVEGP